MTHMELLGLKMGAAPRNLVIGPRGICTGKFGRAAPHLLVKNARDAHCRLYVSSESSVPDHGQVEDDSVTLSFPFLGDDLHAEDRRSLVKEPGISNDAHLNLDWQLELLEKDICRIEDVITNSNEETYKGDQHFINLLEIQSKIERLNVEFHEMQELIDLKDRKLNAALQESEVLKRDLREAEQQISSLNVYKEAKKAMESREMLQLQISSCSSLEALDRHMSINQALNSIHEIVEDVRKTIIGTNANEMALKVIEMLQKEAALSVEALLITTKELEKEKATSANWLLKWQSAVEEIESKKSELSKLTNELTEMKQYNKKVTEELSRAKEQVSSLSQKLANTEKSLENESKSLLSAREGLEKLERALVEEESKVDDLFKEVSSLKAQVEEKERKLKELSEEANKNKVLSEAVKKNINALRESEKKVEQLTAQCNYLESQIRSRDDLLEEIKEETYKSAEALRIASQIKQDLNDSKQREVKLRQDLEKQSSYVEELRQKLEENSRAVRAELALRQAEKNVMDLTKEVEILKNGIKSRDEVIKLLQDKLDGNIDILKTASENRESIKKMQVYINDLELKLRGLNMLQQKPQSLSKSGAIPDEKSFQEF